MATANTANAIIVAAGKGIRMGGPIRKQYLEIEGLPVLSHTLRVFDSAADIQHIYLVVPADEFAYCRDQVMAPISLTTPLTLVPGGSIRQESVWNGLMAVGQSIDVVVIHDGVRPFITARDLSACIETAHAKGACILGIPATDTLKAVSDDGLIQKTVDRHQIWLAQTPQAFRYELIRAAHERARDAGTAATDDAMMLELSGKPVTIIHGSRRNIKITTQEDLLLARALIQSTPLEP